MRATATRGRFSGINNALPEAKKVDLTAGVEAVVSFDTPRALPYHPNVMCFDSTNNLVDCEVKLNTNDLRITSQYNGYAVYSIQSL